MNNDKLAEPAVEMCQCKDRPASKCPGEWEPGCDLGNNEAHAVPAEVPLLSDELAESRREVAQLQEQNTALDAKLAQQEAVMRMALDALSQAAYMDVAMNAAIKVLEEQLK